MLCGDEREGDEEAEGGFVGMLGGWVVDIVALSLSYSTIYCASL